MPLPDERPRQSVANLIGRFEQQTKRSSVIAKSPSVSAHTTGNSEKDEAKKEWPPVQFSPSISYSRPTPSSQPSLAGDASVEALSASQSAPTISAVSERVSRRQSLLEPMVQDPEEPSIPPRSATTSPDRPTPTPKQRPAPAAAAPSSFKSPAKPRVASRPSLPTLKPQITGQSTSSATSTSNRKPPIPKSTPSTPARPSLGAARPKTPSSHAKTPSTPATNRPKTPSSGLFAPTAASMARARSVPPTPTPAKKATSSSATADRLSKPTAASLSKSTAASLSKSRTTGAPAARGKPAARGGAATRGTAAKAKAPARAQKPVEKPSSDPPVEVSASDAIPDHINGHGFEPSQSTEGDEEARQEFEDEGAEEQAVEGEEVEEVEEVEAEGIEHSETEIPPPSPSPPPEVEHTNGDVRVLADPEATKSDDIEDIVNLLESGGPKGRPVSMISIPDEVNEIPDEE